VLLIKDFSFFSSQNNFSSLDICFASLDLLFMLFRGQGKAYTLNAFFAFLVFHATLNFLYFNIEGHTVSKTLGIFQAAALQGAAYDGYCI
jgi:hypothetical protein